MNDLLQAALRQDEENKKDRLIKALLLMQPIYDSNVYYAKAYDAYVCPELHSLAKSAVKGSVSELSIIAELHNEDLLKEYINALNNKEIKSEVIDAVLNASANAKKQEAAPSAVVNYPAHASRTSLRLFDPKKDKAALGVAVGVGVLAVGGLATAFTFMGLASTAISTSTVAMAAVGTAAAAGTAFPPLGIALLAIGGAMLLAASIILIAMTIHHDREMNKFVDGYAKMSVTPTVIR